MGTPLGDMKVAELRHLIEEIVEEKLEEFFGDPDFGLEIKPELREKLVRQLERGDYGRPLEELSNASPNRRGCLR